MEIKREELLADIEGAIDSDSMTELIIMYKMDLYDRLQRETLTGLWAAIERHLKREFDENE